MPRELSINDPPYFSPAADLFQWRKNSGQVGSADQKKHNSGNDRTNHTLFKILV